MAERNADAAQVERLTFFSDAVFAIAMTLLVIELKLPHLESSDAQGLVNALSRMIPNFIGFVVSFLVIGAYWAAHHRAFRWVQRVDETVQWRNLVLLMVIAFLPFPTAMMSELPAVRATAVFYCAVLGIATLLQIRLWRYALRQPGIVAPEAPAAELQMYFRRAWFLLAATIVVGLLSLVVPVLPVSLFWLLPLAIRLGRSEWAGRLAATVERWRHPPKPTDPPIP